MVILSEPVGNISSLRCKVFDVNDCYLAIRVSDFVYRSPIPRLTRLYCLASRADISANSSQTEHYSQFCLLRQIAKKASCACCRYLLSKRLGHELIYHSTTSNPFVLRMSKRSTVQRISEPQPKRPLESRMACSTNVLSSSGFAAGNSPTWARILPTCNRPFRYGISLCGTRRSSPA